MTFASSLLLSKTVHICLHLEKEFSCTGFDLHFAVYYGETHIQQIANTTSLK